MIKDRKLWLLLSLLLNATLLCALIVLARRPPARNEAEVRTEPVALSPAPLVPDAQPPASPASSATDQGEPDWQKCLAQLRTAGVPDRVLAGLVASDFENRWQKQRRELQRSCDRGDVDEDAITRLVEQHDADQEKELKATLGLEGFLKWDKDRVLSDIDTDKVQLSAFETDALYQLRKDLAQREGDLKQTHLSGEIDESDFDAQQSAAETEYKEKLKQLLGDVRFAALQSPEDGAQGQLVRTLKTLNVSDAQAAEMLAAEKQWSDQRAELDRQIQDSKDQGKASQDQMHVLDAARDAEFQRVLGTNGFDALQRTRNGNYRTLQRYATAWQLSSDDIDYVYRAMQDSRKSVAEYSQQAHALEAQGGAVDWPQVEANINEFRQQTQQVIRSYLGDGRFEKVRKNSVFEFASE